MQAVGGGDDFGGFAGVPVENQRVGSRGERAVECYSHLVPDVFAARVDGTGKVAVVDANGFRRRRDGRSQ